MLAGSNYLYAVFNLRGDDLNILVDKKKSDGFNLIKNIRLVFDNSNKLPDGTSEDAKKFLTKLRGFEPYRARVVRISMGKTTPDNSFEFYYNAMFTKTNDLLEQLGYNHMAIYQAIGELL